MKIGIIGLGYWGSKLLRVFQEALGEENTFGFDIDPALAKTAWPADGQVDAVAVVVPAAKHYELVRRALRSGYDVLCEKPLTIDFGDTQELVALAKEKHQVLMVDHTFLYSPAASRAICVSQDQDQLGRILRIHCSRHNPGLLKPDVGVLWDFAPHDLSIICSALGNTVLESCQARLLKLSHDVVDVALVSFITKSGILCTLDLSYVSARKIRRIVFYCEKGMVVYDDLDKRAAVKIYSGHVWDSQPAAGAIPTEPVVAPILQGQEPLGAMVADFIYSCEHGVEPKSGRAIILNVASLLEAINQARLG